MSLSTVEIYDLLSDPLVNEQIDELSCGGRLLVYAVCVIVSLAMWAGVIAGICWIVGRIG